MTDGPPPPYDRAVLVDVLIYHYRTDTSGCGCGWAELGRCHAQHQADVYEASVLARGLSRRPLRPPPEDPGSAGAHRRSG